MTASTNLDLVRSIFVAWERGDFRGTGWAHPEIELVIVDGPDPVSWRGATATGEGMRERLSNFEDWRVEPYEYRELDDERVLVLYQQSGRGKTSGIEIGQMTRTQGAAAFHVRDGKVTRLVLFWDRERAFADRCRSAPPA